VYYRVRDPRIFSAFDLLRELLLDQIRSQIELASAAGDGRGEMTSIGFSNPPYDGSNVKRNEFRLMDTDTECGHEVRLFLINSIVDQEQPHLSVPSSS